MRKSKLYEVFDRLKPAEIRSFLTTLSLKENNLSQNDQELAQRYVEEIVNRKFPQGEATFWEANDLKPLAANKFKTRVLRALERYLLLDALDKEPRLKHILLASKYDHLELRKHLGHHLRELKKEHHNHEEQLIDPYLGELLGQYLKMKARPEKEKKNVQLAFKDISVWNAAMDKFGDYMRMRILVEAYNRKNLFGKGEMISQDIREKIQAIIDHTQDQNVKQFGKLIRLIDQCPPEEYFEIAEASGSFNKEVAHVYQKTYWSIRLNYCINRMNRHMDRSFADEVVQIFGYLEERGLHLDGGQTISQTYMTASMSGGIISGEMNWYSGFLERNWDKVALPSDKERKAFRRFSWAYMALYNKNLSDAQDHIFSFQRSVLYSRTNYVNFAMKIGADKILSKIYFEQNEVIALQRQIRSIRGYVGRSPYPRHLQQQLLSFFDDLLDYSQNNQILTSQQIRNWSLIDQVWGEQYIERQRLKALPGY